jgi:hypothetical protein
MFHCGGRIAFFLMVRGDLSLLAWAGMLTVFVLMIFVLFFMIALICFCILSLFAWHLKASSTWDDVNDEALSIGQQHGLLALETALMSAAMADADASICLRSSLYKLDAKSSSFPEAPRIKLLKTGVFDGTVSPSGQEFISWGPSAAKSSIPKV